MNVDTRHALICPRAGAQVNQDQPLVSRCPTRTLKRLGIPHQAESGEPFTADRNRRVVIVVRRRRQRDAHNREYREKPILLDVTHADPQAQIHLRGGIVDQDRSAACISEARKSQPYARPGLVSFLRTESQTCHFSS